MNTLLLLAWCEAWHHRTRTVILTACLAIVVYLPVAVQVLVARAEASMRARAAATPMVLGAPGSRYDLTLHALYFRTGDASSFAGVTAGHADAVRDERLATVVPLHVRHAARGYPVVGTTLDYFEFRGLRVARGDTLSRLGDCVLGADVAASLGLAPGDHLMTDPENVFDISGGYPLKMRVIGVFDRTNTPDDGAVFVDLRTAWIVSGIGHGHNPAAETAGVNDTPSDPSDPARNIQLNLGAVEYQQITDENIDSFHFHGDTSRFPVTAMIAIPPDDKSATILAARHDSGAVVALRPVRVVDELMAMVFRVKAVFDAIALLVIVATFMLTLLVMWLSVRLRRGEMETMFKIGCGRGVTLTLHALGLAIVIVGGVTVAAVALAATLPMGPTLIRIVLF